MSRPTLVLIDGHALAYRMFFALPVQGFQTKTGEPTNAVYGFARTLLDILDERPDYLAVTFDQGLSGRGERYPDYKGTRDKMPDDLRLQLDRIRELVTAFNIPILELDGYEADDVIGSIAPQAEAQGVDVRIITGDRDMLQLLSERTTVQLPAKRQGNGPEVWDMARFRAEYGLEPAQLVELKGLMGDTSDNIPGVKGVGEKTATKLISEYGSVAGVYEHLDEIKGALREKLAAERDNALLSRDLAQIRRDVPVSLDLDACVAQDYRYEEVERLFRTLEFRSLIDRLPRPQEVHQQLSMFDVQQQVTAARQAGVDYDVIDTPEALARLVERVSAAPTLAFDVETTSTDQMRARLVGIALAVEDGRGYYIPVGHIPPNAPADQSAQPDLLDEHTPRQLPLETVLEALRPALTGAKVAKVGHNAKYDLVVLRRYGIDVTPITFDTMVAEWLSDPSSRNLGLKALAWVRTGVHMTPIEDLIGSGRDQITMDRVPVEKAAAYAAADAAMTLRLMGILRPELEERQGWKLFTEIEMPLIPVLADMEMAGVLLDVDYLHTLSADLGERLSALEQQAYDLSGGYGKFNLGSPRQINEVLFEKLRLPTAGLRKTTHGFTTEAGTLEALRGLHPIVDVILQWRELSKLKSTYVDALPALVNPHTGRVHTNYNQTGTVTGRLSSSDPNLQNIPVRTEEGRRVRQAFIAPAGHKLLSVDYSQVELRILAHYSKDPALLQAFRDGVDIHRATAAAVYGIPLEQVTYEQRRFAKAVNFGLMYGMGAYRLARDSNLTLAEAEDFIAAYFARFPGVRAYLDEARARAARLGYVETLLGRRRYFPELDEKLGRKVGVQARQRAEREAVNMPIQGTAADIIKIAMINLSQALRQGRHQAQMILQVHDELVLEVPDDELPRVVPLVVEVMESAFTLDAPLVAEASVGLNWAEMEPWAK
ncbi:MAG: DNA polymerase I [Aggregatilineaceae bacterium]